MGIVLPFVVQEHALSETIHWDLMLHRPIEAPDENQKVLAVWKFTHPPDGKNLDKPLSAESLPDHRKVYLTYEGPIADDRGRCKIFDHGSYQLIECREDLWKVVFSGRKIKGLFILKKTNRENRWMLEKQHRCG